MKNTVLAVFLTVVAILLWRGDCRADITISVVRPTGIVSENELNVVTIVTSQYEIQTVQARIGDRETNLSFSPCAYVNKYGDCGSGWAGTLFLAGLARGEQLLVVRAVDFFGETAEAQKTFVFDLKPNLSVTAPLDGMVARPDLPISALCTDDDPQGCVSIKVTVDGATITTGQSGLDEIVSLAAYDGRQIALTITATDSLKQQTSVQRTVYVDANPRLHEVATLNGIIWEAQPDRILYLETTATGKALKIHHRESGRETVVMDEPDKLPVYGYLTPSGAIFMEQSGNVLTSVIYDYRNETLIEVGHPNSANSLKVSGNYAIWNQDLKLYLRDLPAGTNTLVSEKAGNWKNDVAANGDVVFWQLVDYEIYRYRPDSGTVRLTTAAADRRNIYPLTDGNNVVFQQTGKSSAPPISIEMLAAAGEATLASYASSSLLNPGTNYQINNGLVAFTRPGAGGISQVWVRATSGAETQITYFGTNSTIEALAPGGEIIFANGQRRYLGRPGQIQPLDIASRLGKVFQRDCRWYQAIGRSLFEIEAHRPGDFNGDDTVDLVDAILALKILAGREVDGIPWSTCQASGADVNNDGRIGLAEGIYIMKNIAD